jgi:hypothetical protein
MGGIRTALPAASWPVLALLTVLACWRPAAAVEHEPVADSPGRWSREQAATWYAAQPWLVGCNYIPSTAINQLEMFQADTFDPETIDRELALAQGLGFNSVRVFLHDLLWLQDREGFLGRCDEFLSIADRHGIGVGQHDGGSRGRSNGGAFEEGSGRSRAECFKHFGSRRPRAASRRLAVA